MSYLQFFGETIEFDTEKSIVNKIFLANDSSNLWPICNQFNATLVAIDMLQWRESNAIGVRYAIELESEIRRITESVM